MADMTCAACGSPETRFFFVKKTRSGSYEIRRCRRCHSAYVWPRPTEVEMESYYRDDAYARRSEESSGGEGDSYHPTGMADARRMVGRCRRLTSGTEFLDIGAGFGEFSRAAREFGFHVEACEPNPNARRAFRERNGFEADASMFDEQYATRRVGLFDVVFLSPPEHLNFFSRSGSIRLFEGHGFCLEGLATVSKVPRRKYEQRIRIPLVRTAAWRGLYAGLSFWNLFGRGMVINAYFRKSPDRA